LKPISAASAALLAYLVWGSLGWPLIHDAPLMHYIAWLIGQGGVPYRDAFDMNLPGVYVLHLAVLSVGGAGDLAWRCFDLGWLAATCAALRVYAQPLGDGVAATAGALLFGLYHLSGGAWRAGQRDFLLGLFLLAGAYGVARGLERDTRWALLAGGLALGAGMTVKPHAGLFWLVCAVVATGWSRQAGRAAWPAGVTVVAGGLAVPALVFGWLAWRGGLGPFWAILTGYVLPLYSQVGRVSVIEATRWHQHGRALFALLALLAGLGVLARTGAGSSPRLVLAGLGAVYGAAHFALQGKGWEYQLDPLALFLCALAPAAVAWRRADGRPRRLDLWGARRPLALAAWALLLVVLVAKGVDAREPAWIVAKTRRVAALTRDLAPLAPAGSTVQVMDTTAGGIHALLRLGLREPTRFIYDFHFFHHVDDPRIRALRTELVAGLRTARPAAVVVMEESWPGLGYERLETFPELRELLEGSFVLAVTGDGYRIYAKRSDS